MSMLDTVSVYEYRNQDWTTQTAEAAIALIASPNCDLKMTGGLARWILDEYGVPLVGTQPYQPATQPAQTSNPIVRDMVATWMNDSSEALPVTTLVLNFIQDSVDTMQEEVFDGTRNYGPTWALTPEGLGFRWALMALKLVQDWAVAESTK